MLVPASVWQPMIQSMDLRRLCSTILEKTIADPDMYQNGLTKIFFRAGMLAALESFRSDRLNSMVTVVQKNVRRLLAVKQYRRLRQATIKIQTWWRGILAKRLVESIRREVSAIRLQTVTRRFIQRRKFFDIRRSIVLFQSRKYPAFLVTCTDLSNFFKAFGVFKLVNASYKTGRSEPRHFCKVYCEECKCYLALSRILFTSSLAFRVVYSSTMSSTSCSFNLAFAVVWHAAN